MVLLQGNYPWDNETKECSSNNNCTLGLGSELNQQLLSATLYPGTYFIILFDDGLQSDTIPCTPFSLGSMLYAEYPQETNINCPGN